jgi:hypothetical protein
MTVHVCGAPGCHDGPNRQPRRTPDPVCDWCAMRIVDALRTMPRHYLALERELPRVTGTGERVTGTRSPQPPVRLEILDAMRTTARILTEWEDVLRAYRLLTPRRTDVREQAAVVRAVHILSRFLPVVLGHPDMAPGFASDILRTRTQLMTLLGQHALRHRLPAPCPHCDLLTLIRDDGDDHVRCMHCHASWAEHEYQALVRVLASTAGRVPSNTG